MSKINFDAHILNLHNREIEGGPVIAADQVASLVLADRGASVDTARGAYQLNALVERIACAKGPIDLTEDEIKLLKKVLGAAVKSKNTSTFLVGRLYGILESSANDN